MKEHAKDYLLEFAEEQADWQKALIYEVIETNGNISDKRKDVLFNYLLSKTNISIPTLTIVQPKAKENIHLCQITHINGVNALKKNQTIKFCDNTTIIYGLNGAGKSGYFKILNEIVGGNQKKEILGNIYNDTSQSIEVMLKYKGNNIDSEFNWSSDITPVQILKKCKVFDSSYLNGLLQQRKADGTLIEPLGLNLFSYLASTIDEFKRKLGSLAIEKKESKPHILLDAFSDENKNVFLNHSVTAQGKLKIEKLYNFSQENKTLLEENNKEKETLCQTNIDDKIKLHRNIRQEYDKLKQEVKEKYEEISDLYPEIKTVLENYKKKKLTNDKARNQLEILKKIPANDSNEWKEFISAGDKYSKNIPDSKKTCPYCRQNLKTDLSLNLIQAYGEFLNDNSETELRQAKKNLDKLQRQLNLFVGGINISDNLHDDLKCFKIGKNLVTDEIKKIETGFNTCKTEFLEMLSTKIVKRQKQLSNISIVDNCLNTRIANYDSEIEQFNEDATKKQSRVASLNEKIKILCENESISNQKDTIEKWFKIHEEEKKMQKKEKSVKTRPITDLSSNAHNKLLTETLREQFLTELKELGYDSLNIKIEKKRGNKGEIETELVLVKNNNLKDILSEGEQKAVALALFLAEVNNQKNNYPIILDDPVNSLDHKVADKFAERLLVIDNQVIIFTHNKLFLDSFETSKKGHICKTIDSACSKANTKHIRIYQVSSEGLNSKGVILSYKENKVETHVREINKELAKSPFNEHDKVATLFRRAVDCCVDEFVFKSLCPTKYSNKNNRIHWDSLKNIGCHTTDIDSLRKIHDRVSGGRMHNGSELEENPIDYDEFKKMAKEIEGIIKNNTTPTPQGVTP